MDWLPVIYPGLVKPIFPVVELYVIGVAEAEIEALALASV
jgi:hypothetical protein